MIRPNRRGRAEVRSGNSLLKFCSPGRICRGFLFLGYPVVTGTGEQRGTRTRLLLQAQERTNPRKKRRIGKAQGSIADNGHSNALPLPKRSGMEAEIGAAMVKEGLSLFEIESFDFGDEEGVIAGDVFLYEVAGQMRKSICEQRDTVEVHRKRTPRRASSAGSCWGLAKRCEKACCESFRMFTAKRRCALR